MKIPYSKKELYRDNLKMKKEIDNLLRVNMELKILNDQAQEEIARVNKIMEEINNGV